MSKLLLACIALLVFSTAGQADDLGCLNVQNACLSMKSCLEWPGADPNDTGRIRSGVGRTAADGGFACAKHHDDVVGGNKYIGDWNRDTKGCLDAGYLRAAQMATNSCQ